MSLGPFAFGILLFWVAGAVIVVATWRSSRQALCHMWLGMLVGGVLMVFGFPFLYLPFWLFGSHTPETFRESYRFCIWLGGGVGGTLVFAGYAIWCIQHAYCEGVEFWRKHLPTL